jgi:hypothetical protein
MYSPEVVQKVAVWRQRIAANQLTETEMQDIVNTLRAGRVGAAVASEASRRKTAKAAVPDADDMLKELGL